MQILASIWDVWTTHTKSLIIAAGQVGITSSGININYMQKDKFAREETVTHQQRVLTMWKLSHPLMFSMGQKNTGVRSVKITKQNVIN